MMQVINNPKRREWNRVLARPASESDTQLAVVREIMEAVRSEGDTAITKYSELFDNNASGIFRISEDVIGKAEEKISKELKKAIGVAARNIRAFHGSDLCETDVIETMPGVRCWKKNLPIDTVGLYIPGGTAPLFSTVLMLGIPANIAGCRKIVLCTPAKDGRVAPPVLFAAKAAGITEIYGVGGAQAIAAMAYGTRSIPRVDKIFGPGNSYVTIAKQLAQLEGVAIDMPAGPSEICVIATEGANPAFVGADLLAQAEHGTDSQVILISTSESLVTAVLKEVLSQLEKLPRKDIALRSLQQSKAVILSSLNDVFDMMNEYAPEHLMLIGNEAETQIDKVKNAGSVFVGAYSPEAAGDYATGTNHTLPTNGFARAYSGVSVGSFMKTISYQNLSREGLESISETVVTMATEEGLDGHANSISIRLHGKC